MEEKAVLAYHRSSLRLRFKVRFLVLALGLMVIGCGKDDGNDSTSSALSSLSGSCAYTDARGKSMCFEYYAMPLANVEQGCASLSGAFTTGQKCSAASLLGYCRHPSIITSDPEYIDAIYYSPGDTVDSATSDCGQLSVNGKQLEFIAGPN